MKAKDLDKGLQARRRGGPLTRAAIAIATLLAALVLSSCGLIGGGGVTQEEYDNLLAQVELANSQLEDALNEANSLRGAGAEVETVRSELAAALQELEAKNTEIESPGQIPEGPDLTLTLEKARLTAIRHARENKLVYPPEFVNASLVWEVTKAEEGEDFFYITIAYRPAGNYVGLPGTEEFIIDRTGSIAFRQVLTLPIETPGGAVIPPEAPPPEPTQ